MKPTTTLAALAAMLASCATTVDGHYWFTHPTNTVEQTHQDYNLCTTSWLNSPLMAEYARQIQAGADEDEAAAAESPTGFAVSYRERAAKRRRDAAELEHVTACMAAIGYKRLWFDEHSPRGRPNREVPKL